MKTILVVFTFVLATFFSLNTEPNGKPTSSKEADSTQTYDVCIQLVDNQGNPTSSNDIYGYAAYNQQTGSYVYPNGYYDDCFYDLPAGTYRFDSYNGYFCGTSSSTVTLSPALENEDGIIMVNLVLWCE